MRSPRQPASFLSSSAATSRPSLFQAFVPVSSFAPSRKSLLTTQRTKAPVGGKRQTWLPTEYEHCFPKLVELTLHEAGGTIAWVSCAMANWPFRAKRTEDTDILSIAARWRNPV